MERVIDNKSIESSQKMSMIDDCLGYKKGVEEFVYALEALIKDCSPLAEEYWGKIENAYFD